MSIVTVEEAQGRLKDIIAGLSPGESLVIVQDGEPVATLARATPKPWPSKAGSYRKPEFWMAPDFDAPLEEFKDYNELASRHLKPATGSKARNGVILNSAA